MHREPRCTSCGIAIYWEPTLVDGEIYCCLGCAEGGPCLCDYDNLPTKGEVKPLVQREQALLGDDYAPQRGIEK